MPDVSKPVQTSPEGDGPLAARLMEHDPMLCAHCGERIEKLEYAVELKILCFGVVVWLHKETRVHYTCLQKALPQAVILR